MKLYIAGPMTGLPEHNFPAFNEMAKALRGKGHEVINPAELDAGETMTHSWDYYLRRDIKKLMDCEGIVLLLGWEKSKGALLEKANAVGLGMPMYTYDYIWDTDSMELVPVPIKAESVLEEAQRLVGGDRGKAYGHPYHDFERTGKMWAAILGVPEVTPAQVALCMVGVKISRECNSPKRDNRVDGPGYFLCLDMIREKEGK
jgi:hypothetical protein